MEEKDFRKIIEDSDERSLDPNEIPDFDLKKADYQVWEFPRDKDDNLLNRGPIKIWASDDPDEAIEHAKSYVAGINKKAERLYYDNEADRLTVEVETVVEVEGEGTENIGSIFEIEVDLMEED